MSEGVANIQRRNPDCASENNTTPKGKNIRMAKVSLHPLFKSLRGKLKGMVFRLSHNGKTSAYLSPDMSRVKWSAAQVAHRERIAELSVYAKVALRNPEIRAFYEQMSIKEKGNKRPYDMALSHYYNGSNLLGKEFHWDIEHWRTMKRYRKPRKR